MVGNPIKKKGWPDETLKTWAVYNPTSRMLHVPSLHAVIMAETDQRKEETEKQETFERAFKAEHTRKPADI